MQHKTETFECLKNFLTLAERHGSSNAEALDFIERSPEADSHLETNRTDIGGEYMCNKLKEYLESQVIPHELTIVRSLQQHGFAERMNWCMNDFP